MADFIKIPPQISGIKPEGFGAKREQGVKNGNTFQEILHQKIQEKDLKISNHAQMRMNMRNIRLTSEQMAKLYEAVDKAEQKGVKESLILMNDMAFVVSIKNRTVITAVDGPSIKQNVFTNIDGAVII